MALTPEQIQAARAKLGVPEGGYGTNYSAAKAPATTGAPAAGVASRLQAAWQPQSVAPAAPKLGDGGLGEFSENAVRAVTAPLVRTGAAIEGALDQTLGRGINVIKGNGFTPTNSAEGANAAADSIEANAETSLAGQAGTVAGTVAPYLSPAGVEKAGSGFIAKHLPGAIRNTAIGTAQTGDPVEGAITGIGGEALGAAAAPIKAAGKGIYKALAIPVSKTEAKMIQAYKARTPFMERVASAIKGDSKAPITADETAFKYSLMGREGDMGVQAVRASDSLWKNLIDPALTRSEKKIDISKFFDDAETLIKKDNPEPSRQNGLMEALKSMREEYKDIGEVSLKELQDFKSQWAEFVPQKAYQGKDIAGAFNDIKNELAGLARKEIYDELGTELKRAYIDYGNLKGLAEWGQNAMTGGKFKGGAGGWISAALEAIITPIGTIGGKTLYKTGEGIEFLGPVGARTLGDLFNED